MRDLTENLTSMMEALATRGASLLADESLSVSEFALLSKAVGDLYAAARPNTLTAFRVDPVIAQTPNVSQFLLTGANGQGVILAVNGSIVPRIRWHWDDDLSLLSFLDGFSTSPGDIVELYLSWRGAGAIPQD
jgi:hypothetical protein